MMDDVIYFDFKKEVDKLCDEKLTGLYAEIQMLNADNEELTKRVGKLEEMVENLINQVRSLRTSEY